MKLPLAAAPFFVLVACASAPPMEYALYTDSFDQTKTATAAAMRVWEPIEKSQRPATAGQFIPDEAPYIAPEGRAGNALLIERGFAAVTAYNEVLALYASGESISTLQPQTGALSANVGALALTVGAPGVGAGFAAAVTGLETLAAALLAVSDRVEFARAAKENSGKVDAFLERVRDFTPDMYKTATAYSNARQVELLKAGRRDDAKAVPADLEKFRRMLASWVLTIDETRRAVDALEAAVIAGEDAGLTLGAVVFWTGELNRHTEAVKFAAQNISDTF